MDLSSILVVVGLIVCTTWLHRLRRRSGRLPPGPYPLPIIGNIHQLGKAPHESLAKLSQTYGPLMSFKFGSVQSLIVTSPEMVRELLQKHGQIFTGRTVAAAAHAHDHHKTSMAFLPVGEEWRKLRRISQEQMFTSTRLQASQELRREKLQQLSEYLEKCRRSGRTVNIGEAVFTTSLNLMSATLFSVQVADFDSDASQEFRRYFEDFVRVAGSPNLADFFPLLKPIDPQGVLRKSQFLFGKLLGYIEDLINRRLEARRSTNKDSRKPETDLLETLLDHMNDTDNNLTIEVVKHLLLDLFVGGADTTSTTLEWAMTELLLNPEVMSKAKHELRSVIGENEQIEESDISRLPYLQAVIKEIFRFRPTAALLLPRKPISEVEVSGYTIPKGTQTIVNLWAIGRDPKVWSNPDVFEPERFLDSKIDFKGQDFELTPFGSGRRMCPGLPLANRMVHLTVATLIHNFDWKLEVGMEAEFHRSQLSGLVLRRILPLMATPIFNS